jgi:transposase
MEITPEQYARVEPHLPTQRGNVSHENLNVINAILFVAENGCKWRALPKHFGNWRTIYTRMNRWAKAGVLDRLFAELRRAQLIRIKIEAVSLVSTIVKVHPDGTGALEKQASSHRQIPRRLEHKSSYGCREYSMRRRVFPFPRASRRCSRGSRTVALNPRGSRIARLLPSIDGLCI